MSVMTELYDAMIEGLATNVPLHAHCLDRFERTCTILPHADEDGAPVEVELYPAVSLTYAGYEEDGREIVTAWQLGCGVMLSHEVALVEEVREINIHGERRNVFFHRPTAWLAERAVRDLAWQALRSLRLAAHFERGGEMSRGIDRPDGIAAAGISVFTVSIPQTNKTRV